MHARSFKPCALRNHDSALCSPQAPSKLWASPRPHPRPGGDGVNRSWGVAPGADTEQTAVTLPAVPRRHPSQLPSCTQPLGREGSCVCRGTPVPGALTAAAGQGATPRPPPAVQGCGAGGGRSCVHRRGSDGPSVLLQTGKLRPELGCGEKTSGLKATGSCLLL